MKPTSLVLLLVCLPLTLGAQGDGCAANSRSPAPDVTGTWDVTYDDTLSVEVAIGGAVYQQTLGASGGVFTINHNGQPLEFDLNCDRPEVLCPSEAWPATVRADQRNTTFEHRMIVTLPTQSCDGVLVEPDPSECGEGTLNETCDMVCDGTMTVQDAERFGVIGETGDTFRLFLGAGAATNGINCALLGVSLADADISTTGGPDTGDWQAVSFDNGLVTVGYAGGCLWAGDPNMDGQLEALVVSAAIKFTTGFTALRR
jgi:hypothetical protein